MGCLITCSATKIMRGEESKHIIVLSWQSSRASEVFGTNLTTYLLYVSMNHVRVPKREDRILEPVEFGQHEEGGTIQSCCCAKDHEEGLLGETKKLGF